MGDEGKCRNYYGRMSAKEREQQRRKWLDSLRKAANKRR